MANSKNTIQSALTLMEYKILSTSEEINYWQKRIEEECQILTESDIAYIGLIKEKISGKKILIRELEAFHFMIAKIMDIETENTNISSEGIRRNLTSLEARTKE